MSKLTILDWQKDSLLMARGSGRGAKALLDQVSYQPIGESADGHKVTAEEALHTAVAELGAKGDVTVVLSREVVEVRTVSIPRIAPDEVPDVIRFQAQRQLANMTDTWALDYVILPAVPGQEMQTALVGSLSPGHLAELERICAGAGLQVTRIVLRPIEIARFAVQSGRLETAGASMVVCVSENAAELLILSDGHVVQVRGTHLPSEPEAIATSLKGEIRRSLMAASPLLGTTSLSGVLLISSSATADWLDGIVSNAAGAQVTHIDPTTMLPVAMDARPKLVASAAHRLAAIGGALSSDTADKGSLFDFKNPKKRAPKKANTGRYLLYGGAAAVLLAGGLSWWISTSRRLDMEIAHFKSQTAEKKETIDWANIKVKDFDEVQRFLDSSPNWLDELTYIAQKIPASEKVLLEAPTFSIQQRDGTALISVPVRADESSTISAFEKALQDEHHVVKGNDPAMLPQANDGYNWRVVESINITGRGWDVFASKPTVKSNTEAAEPSLKVTAKPDEQTPPTPAETSEPTGQLPGIETDVPLADPPSVESGADANSTVSPTTEVPAATESSAEPSEGEIIPNRETVAAPVSGGDTDEHDNDGEPETTTVESAPAAATPSVVTDEAGI